MQRQLHPLYQLSSVRCIKGYPPCLRGWHECLDTGIYPLTCCRNPITEEGEALPIIGSVDQINKINQSDQTNRVLSSSYFDYKVAMKMANVYDTSFLNRKKVVIDGDVECNPGPIASVQAHRTAIGTYYNKAIFLSNPSDQQIHFCSCKKYEDYVFKLTGYNLLTTRAFFYDEQHHNEQELIIDGHDNEDELIIDTLIDAQIHPCPKNKKNITAFIDNPANIRLLGGSIDETPEKGKDRQASKKNFVPTKLGMDIKLDIDSHQDNIVHISEDLRHKISIRQSDITNVKCDAIVNAANITLLGGGGIDGIIHEKAGPVLLKKCRKLLVKEKSISGKDIRCYPGECEVTDTDGSNLTNCKYVFHTVGPDCTKEKDMNYNASILRSCYESCLQMCKGKLILIHKSF